MRRRRTCSASSAGCCRSAWPWCWPPIPASSSSGRGCSATSSILGLAAITIGVLRLRLLVLLSAAATALAFVVWSVHLGAVTSPVGPAMVVLLLTAIYNVLGRLWPGSPAERREPADAVAPRRRRPDRRRRAGPLLAQPARPDHAARGPRDRHRRAAVPGRRRAQFGRRRAAGPAGHRGRDGRPRPRLVRARRAPRAVRRPAGVRPRAGRSPTRSSRSSAIGSASTTTRRGCCAPIWPCSSRPSSPTSACTAPWRGPPTPRRRRSSRCSVSTSRWCCSSRSAAPGRRSCRWRRSPPVSSPASWHALHFTLDTGTVAVVAEIAIYLLFVALPFVLTAAQPGVWRRAAGVWLTSALIGPALFLLFRAGLAGLLGSGRHRPPRGDPRRGQRDLARRRLAHLQRRRGRRRSRRGGAPAELPGAVRRDRARLRRGRDLAAAREAVAHDRPGRSRPPRCSGCSAWCRTRGSSTSA